MTLLVILTIFYVMLIIFDLKTIYFKKQWKLFGVYLIMMIASYIIQVLLIFDVKLPAISGYLEKIAVYVLRL